jgi:hypothetical protein
MNMPAPTVLLWNLDGERGRGWRLAAMRLKIRVRDVHPAEYGAPLGALLRAGPADAPAPGPVMAFSEPMLLID